MQNIAPGHYEIVARLSYGNPPNNEHSIESSPVVLEVRALSASLTPAEAASHAISLAQGSLDEGDVSRAATLIADGLKQNPDDVHALVVRSHIEERQGNLVAALADISHALQPFEKTPDTIPSELVAYQSSLLMKLLGYTEVAPAAATAVTASASSAATAASSLRPPKPQPATNSNPAANAIVLKPAGTSFAGMWVTPFGRVMISEFDGKFVTYCHDKLGMIEGTVSGDTARGTWKNGNNTGRILLKLSADGKTFTGAFTTGTAEPELGMSAAWDGTRSR